jgi:hypothetical protein
VRIQVSNIRKYICQLYTLEGFLPWDSNNEAFTDKIFKFSLTSFKAL